jgi:hypothetical protein
LDKNYFGDQPGEDQSPITESVNKLIQEWEIMSTIKIPE